MKYLFLTVLIGLAVIPATVAHAQTNSLEGAPANQADLLDTDPITVNRSPRRNSVYQRYQLQNVGNSIKAKPQPVVQDDPLSELIPKPVQQFLPPAPKPKPTDPLEFFKVPPPDGSVKVNVF